MRSALAVLVSLALPSIAVGQSVEEVQRAIDGDRVIVVDQEQMDAIRNQATPAYDPGQQLERQMAGVRMIEAHRREQAHERAQLRLVWAVLMLLGVGVVIARAIAKRNAQNAEASISAPDGATEDDEDDLDDEVFDDDDLDDDDAPADDEADPRADRDARYDDELARLLDE